jgi:hypothetical protein
VFFDAMRVKVRRQGAVRATTVTHGVGIGADGQRELLGLHLSYGETKGGLRRFIKELKARGLPFVRVATSDAHEGLRQALPCVVPRADLTALSGALPAQRDRPDAAPADSGYAESTIIALCHHVESCLPFIRRLAVEQC